MERPTVSRQKQPTPSCRACGVPLGCADDVNLGKWTFNILVSLDQFGNTLFGGDPDETISSRSAKANQKGKWWGRAMCRFLDVFDKGHCAKSVEHDEGKNAVIKSSVT